MKKKLLISAFSVLISAAITASFISPLKMFADNAIEIRISLINKIEYVSKGSTPTADERKNAAEALKSISQTAYDAFTMDHPKRSMWIDINRSRIEAISESHRDGDLFVWRVIELRNRISVLPEYSDPEGMTAELDAVIKSFTPIGDTLYDKVKSIHDYICLLTEYDTTSPHAYSAYGALVDRKSVCEGYAEAFRLICEINGIECILVSGKGIALKNIDGQLTEYSENHMWNYVKMDDGQWYAVDATWDDGKTISYEYLLVGSETVVNSINGRQFCQNHLPSGDISGTGLFTFTLPELSENSYFDNHRPITDTSGTVSDDITSDTSETASAESPFASQTSEDEISVTESEAFDTAPADSMQAAFVISSHTKSVSEPPSTSTYYYDQLNDEQKNFYDELMKVAPPSGDNSVTIDKISEFDTTFFETITDTTPSHTTTPPQTKPPKPTSYDSENTNAVLTETDTSWSNTVTNSGTVTSAESDSFTVTIVDGKTTDDAAAIPSDNESRISLRYILHITVIVLAIGSLFCIIGILILKLQSRDKK